jgi:hypothetical protein
MQVEREEFAGWGTPLLFKDNLGLLNGLGIDSAFLTPLARPWVYLERLRRGLSHDDALARHATKRTYDTAVCGEGVSEAY